MRNITIFSLLITLATICSFNLEAQPAASNFSGSSLVEESGYSITENGPHHRVWKSVVAQTNDLGIVSFHTNAFTELATGLNHLVGGQWISSTEDIQLTPTGGAATNTQHQVYFFANINTPGSIDLITPQGRHLTGTVLGLSLYDTTSGQNSIIAQVQDSIGEISGNQVLYTNALIDARSDFQADVLYTHKRTGFEQDVILHQQPPSPASLGLNPDTTMLQVWTEFYNTSDPETSTNTISVSVNDSGKVSRQTLGSEILDFGSMQMGQGNAFVSGGLTNLDEASFGNLLLVPVAKHWIREGTRRFLVEEVPFNSIVQQLSALPAASPAGSGGGGTNSDQSFFRIPAKTQSKQAKSQSLRLAKVDLRVRSGFVLDYVTLINNVTNYTFQSDTTYYVSGALNLYGATTVEGGAVIKSATTSSGTVIINGDVKWLTAPYRPAVFTSTNDNSVGVALPGSTGTPVLGQTTYLYAPGGSNISNVRFSYGFNAYSVGGADVEISDCQFVKCSHPITVNTGTTKLRLHNVLMTMDPTLNGPGSWQGGGWGITMYSTGLAFSGEHVTADIGSHNLVEYTSSQLGSFALTNSIVLAQSLLDCTSGTSVATVSTNSVFYAASSSALFQTNGGASYYLAATSPVLGLGTTNISPVVLSDIQQKTTHPPLNYADTIISNNLSLGLQATRDTASNPDLGYHYDPIDFAFGADFLTNATITVLPGTVIAGFDTNSVGYALTIGPGGQFLCQGTPTSLNRIVGFNTVQEAINGNWQIPTQGLILANWFMASPASVLNFRFSDFSIIADDTAHVFAVAGNTLPINFQDCQFHGGSLTSTNPTINLTNCLLERVNAKLWSYDANTPHIQNTLFWNGTNDIQLDSKTSAVVQNNLFDKTALNDHGDTGYSGGYNGYVTNFTRLTLNNSTDKVLTNSPAYQIGPLGNYYLPTNCPLINVGSTTADVLGLFHYTTLTNQVKETNSVVDIGYHYVAVNSSGQPDDTDGDGIPDYVEDANGNGLVDSGETSWLDPNDLGLTVVITRPVNNSIIP